MKKIILITILSILSFSLFAEDISRPKLKATTALIADLYFIYRGDTINFFGFTQSMFSASDSGTYHTYPVNHDNFMKIFKTGYDSLIIPTWGKLKDTLQYYFLAQDLSDSISSQLNDSLLRYVQLKDSTLKYVTPNQLNDSLLDILGYLDTTLVLVTQHQINERLAEIGLDTASVRSIALDVLRDTIPNIDSVAFQEQIRQLKDSLSHYPKSPQMIYNTIPITSTNISVFYGFTMASPRYSLNVKAWYEVVRDGKTIRVTNGIYDLDSTASGFTCKVRVPSGYLDYEAKDTLGILTYQSGWSESDPVYIANDYQNNVKYWGAKGDGITNDSAAFKMAFDSCQHIYVPSGSYIIGNTTVKHNNFSITGDGESSKLIFRTGATGIMLDCDSFQVDVSNLTISGGVNTDYRYSSYSGKDRNGIALKSSRNSRLSGLTIMGFENRGIWLDDKVTAAPIIERLTVDKVWFMYNYIGLETGLNGEQHALYSTLFCVMNRFGIIGGEGNLNFSLCTLDKNYYGFYLDGTRANDGHGNMVSGLFNHNIIPIWARQLSNGFTFVGNQIHQGTLIIDTCTNVIIENGRVDLTTWSLHGTGLNYIRNNVVGGNYGNTITKSRGCGTVFVNNQSATGTYLENRSSNNIYITGGSPMLTMQDTTGTDYYTLYFDKTGANFKTPVYCKSLATSGNPFRAYNSAGKLLTFLNQSSDSVLDLYLRDNALTNRVRFSSTLQSYINTSTGFIIGGTSTAYCFAVTANGNSTGIAYLKNDKDAVNDSIIAFTTVGGMTVSDQILKGKEQSKVPGVLFTQTASKTIANTTTETSLLTTGVGSLTLPASCLTAGKTIRIKLQGYLSSNVGVNTTLKIKIGSVELITSTGSVPKAFTDALIEMSFTFTCRTTGSTGTVIGQGGTIFYDGLGITNGYVRPLLMTSTATVNTTISNTLDVTYTWGTADAGNTITCTNTTIEILN